MASDQDTWAERWTVSMNDLLEVSIDKLSKIVKDSLGERDKKSDDGNDLFEVLNICYHLACKVSGWYERKYPTIIPWLPEDELQLENLTLLRCKSPKSIVLTYSVTDDDLFKNYTSEMLAKFVVTPKEEGFVCVSHRKKMFRGLVLEVLSHNRLKVLNIDTNGIFIVPTSSIFHLPPEVCDLHALSLHCTMTEEDEVIENLWSEDLEAVLLRALQECSMRVEILKVVCEFPPKYYVEMYGTNAEGLTINLTNWLQNVLIPDMKQCSPHLMTKKEMLYFLKDESIYPFGDAQNELSVQKVSNTSYKERGMSSLANFTSAMGSNVNSCANSVIALSIADEKDQKDDFISHWTRAGKCQEVTLPSSRSCFKNGGFSIAGGQDTWAESWTVSMNDLLEVSISKLSRIVKDFLGEKDKRFDDGNDLLEVHKICYDLASKVSGWYERKYPAIIPWLPEDKSLLENLTVLRCESPRSIVLTYSVIDDDLFKNHTFETLAKFVVTPKEGGFVCVNHRKKLFRGLVLEILTRDRLKVLNIDTNGIFIVPPSSIFHLPPEVCDLHALSLHCTMTEEDGVVENLWSEDLEAVLSRALQECSIRIEISNVICEFPPKYCVEMYGTNGEGLTINLTNWLQSVLIPDIKQCSPLLMTKEELLYFLKDESIYPFGDGQDKLNVQPVSNTSYKARMLPSLANIAPTLESNAKSCANSVIALSIADKDNFMSHWTRAGKCQEATLPSNFGFSCLSLKPGDPCSDSYQSSLPQVCNRIKLPSVGERVNVMITHVLSSLSFYVSLDKEFSNIVVRKGTESYCTLISRMNHPLNIIKHTAFLMPPTIGQLVAFRGKSSSNWVRGVITYVNNNSVTVINPDVGVIETVETKDLRCLAPEDTLLPFQAILTFLHNIQLAENCADKAKNLFIQLISSKTLYAIVKAVHTNQTALEVELFTSEDLSINDALLESGYCVQVCPSVK